MATAFQRYLLPGVVFMSVVVGGGYATGRELAQFILPLGPWGGLLGQAVAATICCVVLAISFELVRVARTYDYRSFIGLLLGRWWFLFEPHTWRCCCWRSQCSALRRARLRRSPRDCHRWSARSA